MRFQNRGINSRRLIANSISVWRYMLVLIMATGLLVFSSSAFALPLLGSTFDAGDGTQEGAPQDWTDFTSLLCGTQPCLTTIEDLINDDHFSPAGKQDEPDKWEHTTNKNQQHNPAKDNILTAWHIVDDPYFYVSFAREKPQGNTELSIELNQTTQTFINSKQTEVPCRQDGDLLVRYDVDSQLVPVDLKLWTSATTLTVNGLECGLEGQFDSIASDVSSENWVAAMNTSPIVHFLPSTNPKILSATQLRSRLFAEAALNIEGLQTELEGLFPTRGCPTYSQVWFHSASSNAGVSNRDMKDFVAPQPVTLHQCATGPTQPPIPPIPPEPPVTEPEEPDDGDILGLGGQPVVPAAGTPAPVASAAPAEPSQEPDQEGTATLSRMPVCPTRIFTVSVTGENMEQATFFLDGKKLKRVKAGASKSKQAKSATRKNRRAAARKKARRRAAHNRSNRRWVSARSSQNRISLGINARTLRSGTHSLRVKVKFTDGTTPETKTLRAKVTKCPPTTLPLFTG